MSDEQAKAPDFRAGVRFDDLVDGKALVGRVGDEDAILVRRDGTVYALGAQCTHYHGPLADGIVVGDTIRCPWHHACFSLKSGEALGAPALDPIACWRVERVGDKVVVHEKIAPAARPPSHPGAPARNPSSIVIVGGGAAGLAAADMLRREGYAGPVTMLSADVDAPCDRPNLSKDFLAGNAPDDWMPLRGPDWYAERGIELRLRTRVAALDTQAKVAIADDGTRHAYDALLLATGADPVRLDIPGAGRDVFYLRSFADSRAIAARAATAKRAVVVGASFIGLEVAASLRARNLEVQVVGPESVPLERVLGRELGLHIRALHESHGVVFHLGRTVGRIDGSTVMLDDGTRLAADFVVIGAGVRPATALAQAAGLAIDRGIAVDAYLATSAPGVYAAGDAARWPDARSGEAIRVEHWVVAQRMGQAAARNMLGRREPFADVPFFWSQHYDTTVSYVGHAERWDEIAIDGALDANDATVTYKRGGRTLAVATLGRDRQSLEAEATMAEALPAAR